MQIALVMAAARSDTGEFFINVLIIKQSKLLVARKPRVHPKPPSYTYNLPAQMISFFY